APAPTLTSNDVPPGYDEVYLSLADVLMGPIHGQMVWESFLRREPAPGPQLVLSVGMTAPEFAFIASQPSAQRPMHDAAADGFFRAADNFAGLHRNLAAGTSQGVETLRSAREAVEPPTLEAGTWMTMDTYRYQRGAEEGDGAIAM